MKPKVDWISCVNVEAECDILNIKVNVPVDKYVINRIEMALTGEFDSMDIIGVYFNHYKGWDDGHGSYAPSISGTPGLKQALAKTLGDIFGVDPTTIELEDDGEREPYDGADYTGIRVNSNIVQKVDRYWQKIKHLHVDKTPPDEAEIMRRIQIRPSYITKVKNQTAAMQIAAVQNSPNLIKRLKIKPEVWADLKVKAAVMKYALNLIKMSDDQLEAGYLLNSMSYNKCPWPELAVMKKAIR